VLFAGLAFLARFAWSSPLAWSWAAALTLALLTEGLQYFASNRDPSWFDVGIDMAGVGLGLLLAWLVVRLRSLRFQ